MAPHARTLSRQTLGSLLSPRPEPLAVGGVRVRPISRSFIVPAIRTREHWLNLSNLDRVVNPTFSSLILFYKNLVANGRCFEDVIASLKDSLARVLVDFYPMAGRLALQKDGLVEVHCNDEGAIFIEATMDAELSAVGGAKPMPALSGLDFARLGHGPTYVPDQLRSMPVLVIMVTKFKCGSIAIAVNWHHTVADGCSGCHFIKAWTEVATGKQPSIVPFHDRSLLKPRENPDDSLVNGYSTRTIKDLVESHDMQLTKSYLEIPKEPAILGSFHISKDAIQGLKDKVNLEDEEGRRFTSAESISAHLWRQMTKARSTADEKDGTMPRDSQTRFFMFVDGRKRMNLPSGYFGNCVSSACAVSSEEDILEKPLSYAAKLIREATRSISGEYFRSLIDWVEIQGRVPSKSEHVNSVGHDVAATFWTFFPLYEMDFGWGKPDLAARNSPARPLIDGIAMMPSTEGPAAGGMVALLNLHADRMNRLTRQASFEAVFS